MSGSAAIVHIVDDDASFLAATARLLAASGFAVKTFAGAGEFLAQCGPDTRGCVIADLQMPGLDGLALQDALARLPNPLPLLFLTGAGDIPSSVRAMRMGAEDFLEKRAPREELLDAVRRSLARDLQEWGQRAGQETLQARFDKLSEREREVLSHVLRGRLNKQMADDMRISERTVKLHRSAIMSKVGVRSVAELARLAQDGGVR